MPISTQHFKGLPHPGKPACTPCLPSPTTPREHSDLGRLEKLPEDLLIDQILGRAASHPQFLQRFSEVNHRAAQVAFACAKTLVRAQQQRQFDNAQAGLSLPLPASYRSTHRKQERAEQQASLFLNKLQLRCGQRAAMVWATEGHWPEVERLNQAILADHPYNVVALCALAQAQTLLGRYKEACHSFGRAIKIDGACQKALLGLGNTKLLQQNFRAAAPFFERARALDDECIDAVRGLAWSLRGLRQYTRAAALFVRVMAAAPGVAQDHVGYGLVALAQGNAQAAIDHLREALALDDADAAVHYELARALARNADVAEAQRHYESCLRLGGADPACSLGLAEVLRAQGKCSEAIAHYEDALMDKKFRFEAALGMGYALIDLHQFNAAKTLFLDAIDASALRPEGYVGLGDVLCITADHRGAAQAYCKALSINKHHLPAEWGRKKLVALQSQSNLPQKSVFWQKFGVSWLFAKAASR